MRSKNSRQVARPPGHQKNHWGLETGNWRLSRGFTFIELLLSISILSIVMLAVYSAFALGINTYQRFNAVNLNERKVVLGLEKIGDELRQCLDFPDIGFEGNKEKLSFPVAADGQIVKINYSFDSEKNFLYRQEQTQREILKEEEPSEKESLSKEFLSFLCPALNNLSEVSLRTLWKKNGAVLIVTIWVLVILVILGGGLARVVKWVGYLERRLLAVNLAKAAVRWMVLEREKDLTPEYDSIYELQKKRVKELGRGKFVSSIVDEESKININTATQELLANLPGMTPEAAKNIYESKFKPFSLIEEVLLIEGITEEKFSSFKGFITVYGKGKVNINTAPPEVLRSLGLKEDLIEIIERFRRGDDGELATEDDRIFESTGSILNNLQEFTILSVEQSQQIISLLSKNLLTVQSENLRVDIQTEVDNKPNKEFSVVLKPEAEGMRVVRWEEK